MKGDHFGSIETYIPSFFYKHHNLYCAENQLNCVNQGRYVNEITCVVVKDESIIISAYGLIQSYDSIITLTGQRP